MRTRSPMWLVGPLGIVAATAAAHAAPAAGPTVPPSLVAQVAPDTGESVTTILIDRAMPPPPWVAAQRTLLASSGAIAEAYAASNFDARGHAIRTAPPAWGTGDGPDDIYGGSGNDSLVGGNGFDFLFGQSGNDRLSGGA